MTAVLTAALVACAVAVTAVDGSGCNTQETVEAEKAFKNCVESAQVRLENLNYPN